MWPIIDMGLIKKKHTFLRILFEFTYNLIIPLINNLIELTAVHQTKIIIFSSPKDWGCKAHSHGIFQNLIFDLNTMAGCPKHQYFTRVDSVKIIQNRKKTLMK